MFALDSKFYSFTVVVYRVVLTNVLFLMMSLPILTFAPAFSALVQTLRNEDTKIISSYFGYFKESFAKTFPIGVFNLFSLFFYFSLNTIAVDHSLFLQLLMWVFSMFLISYNINLYFSQQIIDYGKSYYKLFQMNFFLSLQLFYKVIWLFPVFWFIYRYSVSLVGGIAYLFIVSLFLTFYLRAFNIIEE